jgi:hypothetical protein
MGASQNGRRSPHEQAISRKTIEDIIMTSGPKMHHTEGPYHRRLINRQRTIVAPVGNG